MLVFDIIYDCQKRANCIVISFLQIERAASQHCQIE